MTSISVGLGLRLTLLFVVSLHPGIKMVQYARPISSLGVFLQWSVIPSRGGVTIPLGASQVAQARNLERKLLTVKLTKWS